MIYDIPSPLWHPYFLNLLSESIRQRFWLGAPSICLITHWSNSNTVLLDDVLWEMCGWKLRKLTNKIGGKLKITDKPQATSISLCVHLSGCQVVYISNQELTFLFLLLMQYHISCTSVIYILPFFKYISGCGFELKLFFLFFYLFNHT